MQNWRRNVRCNRQAAAGYLAWRFNNGDELDESRYYRCGKGHTALVLGGGAFANAGGGGALGVGVARTRLEAAAASFAALPPADQESQVMDWASRVKGEPPARNHYEAVEMLRARNTHDILTYTQAMAVVGKRKLRGMGLDPTYVEGRINGELDNRLKKLSDHPITSIGEALEMRRMLDEVRGGETAHCRRCGRFVAGAVDTPDCPHCTGGTCPTCAGRNHAAVRLAKLRAAAPAAASISAAASPPSEPEKAPAAHYPFARPAGTPWSAEEIEAMSAAEEGDEDATTEEMADPTPSSTGEDTVATSGAAGGGTSSAPATPPPPTSARVTDLTAVPPTGTVLDPKTDVIAMMFAGYSAGGDWELPSGERLPLSKQFSVASAATAGIDLPAVLAPVSAKRGNGTIRVSDHFLDGVLQNKGRGEWQGDVLRAPFDDGTHGEVFAYAAVVPKAGGLAELRTYCTCGKSFCEHQLVAQGAALASEYGADILDASFHRQQRERWVVDASSWSRLTAGDALAAQDADYRSIQAIAEYGWGTIIGGDDSLLGVYDQRELAARPTPPTVAAPVSAAAATEVAEGGAKEGAAEGEPPATSVTEGVPPRRAASYSPPDGLSPEQLKLAAIIGDGLPGNRPRAEYSPQMQALIPSPGSRASYILTEAHEEVALVLNPRLQSDDPGERVIGLSGPPGTGKNEVAAQVAAVLQMPYYSVDCSSGVSAQDLTGGEVLRSREVRAADGSVSYVTETQFRLGPIAQVARDGGVVAVNEIVSADPAVLTKMHDMVAERRISVDTVSGEAEYIPVHPDTIFVFTWNPNSSAMTAGLKPGEALRSRMKPIELAAPKEADLARQLASQVRRSRGYEVKDSDPLVGAGALMFTRLAQLRSQNAIESEVSPRDVMGLVSFLVHRRAVGGGKLSDRDHKLAIKQLTSLCAQDPSLFAAQKRDLATAYYNVFNKLGLTRQFGPEEF